MTEKFVPFLSAALDVSPDFLTIYQLAGDASSRKYFRVIEKDSKGMQTSHVLMVWEPFEPDHYPFLSVLAHLARHHVGVPDVLSMSPEQGWVLLEDLGDLTLERKFWENQNQNRVLPYYKKAIDELVKIHFNASLDRDSNCTAFKVMFDIEKFLWELNYGKENLIKGLCQFQLSERVDTELTGAFTSICERLHAEPKTICHRDYHSRNLMLMFDDIRVIDFQDARMGPVQYDLVSLFKDSYVNLNDESATELTNYYLDRAKEFSALPFSTEKFAMIYELQSVQRCFKACGSFASFYNQRRDSRYLKYIGGTLKRVLKSLSQFPEYRVLTEVIIDSGSVERDYNSLAGLST